jgi:hypothetical protein
MPSADCPSAIGSPCGSLTATVAVHLCPPRLGSSRSTRQLTTCQGIGKPVPSVPAFCSQSLGLSRGTPGCFRCVTVESTRSAAVLFGTGNWDFRLCCILVPRAPRLYPPAGCQSTCILCAIGPHLRLGLPQGRLTDETFASDYPSALPTWDRTCSLNLPKPHDMLDTHLSFGTLAERTGKQPGKARHTTRRCSDCRG